MKTVNLPFGMTGCSGSTDLYHFHAYNARFGLFFLQSEWGNLITIPSKDKIKKLKSLLVDLEGRHWTVKPRLAFQKELYVNMPENNTQRGAAGRPPKNMNAAV
jgi:hypothetical protein